MLRQLVLGIFPDEASADAAAAELKHWADVEDATTLVNSDRIQAMGVLALDADGKLKVDKLGPRSIGAGAGIGLLLAMITPIGLAVGVIGGGILGAFHHKTPIIPGDARERLGLELQGGKAAVGVTTDKGSAPAIAAELGLLGGSPEVHELDDAAVAALDAAAAADPAAKTAPSA